MLCSEAYAARIMRSVLQTVAQLHAHGVVWRDSKPENFLFLNTRDDSPLKAVDFGTAVRCAPGEYITARAGRRPAPPSHPVCPLFTENRGEEQGRGWSRNEHSASPCDHPPVALSPSPETLLRRHFAMSKGFFPPENMPFVGNQSSRCVR